MKYIYVYESRAITSNRNIQNIEKTENLNWREENKSHGWTKEVGVPKKILNVPFLHIRKCVD